MPSEVEVLTRRVRELEQKLSEYETKSVTLSRDSNGLITHINSRPVLRDDNKLIIGTWD